MEAFVTNKAIADENFTEALKIALDDSYEITRRIALGYAPKNASPELIPYIVETLADPTASKREDFQAGFALPEFDAKEMVEAIDSIRANYPEWFTDKMFAEVCDDIQYDANSKQKRYKAMLSGEYSPGKTIFYIEIERNKCSLDALDVLYHMIENGEERMQVLAAEILGWYVYSYKKPEILDKVKELYNNAPEGAVKNELLKTINRLEVKRS
ncbi:MAG: hypothetical protein IKY70_06880 [Bacteroidales bacterium]|nr:hypothetical protein [Bacteroidales bacterium]